MKRILIINMAQFGYHSDTYYSCRYLKHRYRPVCLCWDYGQKRIEEPGVEVRYIPRDGAFVVRMVRFLSAVLRETGGNDYDVVFVVYFRLCSFLAILRRSRTLILDIRTGYVLPGMVRGLLYNAAIRLESIPFRRVTVITEELRALLRIPPKKCHILPLGAEPWDIRPAPLNALRLLYVGTFDGRRIDETVRGFDRFASKVRGRAAVSYDIIGFGLPADAGRMEAAIGSAANRDLIRFHGLVPHRDLPPHFSRCNVGVVYVPIVARQEPQPYTKTYEYLLAGMPVVATANSSNRKMIVDANGVLVQDDPDAFAAGLERVLERLGTYDPVAIRREAMQHSWRSIVETNLLPYLDSQVRR
ncbi:MAG: glycosyltransferase [Bacteroidota bacterium]